MSPALFELLTVFVKSPGDLVYFLLVVLFSVVSLFMAFDLRQSKATQEASRRYSIAFVGVVLAWLLMAVGIVFANLTQQNPNAIVPPLERLISVVVVVLVGWAFLTADHTQWRRASNLIVLLLLGVALVAYLFMSMEWTRLLEGGIADFNLAFSASWAVVLAFLAVLGIILMLVLFRLVTDAPLKIIFFVLILIGNLYQALQGPFIGSYPGAVRLSFVLALLMVPIVLYRLMSVEMATLRQAPPTPAPKSEPPSRIQVTPQKGVTAPLENQSALLMKALGLILNDATASALPEQIIKATLEVLRADVGFVLRVQDANYADIFYAYDRIFKRSPSGISLNLNNQPTLVNVIERRLPRNLYIDRNREELEDLYTRLDVDKIGTVYFYPLVRGNELIAILGVGSPYSERELDAPSQELLKSISILATNLIALSDEANEARILAEDRAIQAMVEGVALSQMPDDAVVGRQDMQSSLQVARDQITQLSKQVMQLKLQLDDERTRLANLLSDSKKGLSISQTVVAIVDEQQKVREERDNLARRLQEAETALMGATATSNQAVINQMSETIERERNKLMQERDRLQAQLNEMQIQGNLVLPDYMQQIVTRMQEEQSRLEAEKYQLSDKLSVVQNQLQALGLESDVSGLAQLISQLYEERATLTNRNTQLSRDKDLLLSERAKLEDSINRARENDARMAQLQTEIENLAQDREVIIKQRDKLRGEFDEAKEKLDAVKEHRARLLAQVSGYELELTEANEEQVRLRAEIQSLADARSDLMHLRDKLFVEKESITTERNQLLARAEGDRGRLQELSEEGVGKLREMIDELSQARNRLEHELNEAKTQLGKQAETGKAQRTTEMIPQVPLPTSYQTKNPELFVGLVQELRTPLTSLIGYVDLLLGESAGILGEMQRKFLQRVSTNIARLETMITDLIHVAQLDTGQFKFEPMPVSVVALIEDAITNASIQFREKGLTINLDLDDDLPFLPADKDALQQIIGQLLTNAYLVSPPNTELNIIAQQKVMQIDPKGSPVAVIAVSVEDRGGGIQLEDVPRVFARKYKAENPLIQGLGDTGVGLSIAKALAEVHGGRLWVETKPDLGSIFSFVLPLTSEPER